MPFPAKKGTVITSTQATITPGPTLPHRPVAAFTGLPRPATASVQQARQSSIKRNLHGSGAGSSRASAAGSSRVSAVSSSPTSSNKQRKSGPPRSFTDTPASIPALNDFAAVTAVTAATCHLGNHLVWYFLPKVIYCALQLDNSDFNDTLDLSPRYFWKSAEEIENVQTALQTAGLVFNVDVSTTGPIFEAIELGFRDHCATNNIDYVAPTLVAAIPSPNTMSYVLPGPRGRANGRTWVEDLKSLTRFTFTLQSLRSAPYSHTEAPRLRNLFAPIDCLFGPTSRLPNYVLPHRCFEI
ncbi:hypothetical protein R3P38DRAFT_2793715 [Favolaschia claudopus]|uniref:Coat protein n=1 Tax=Favolaschia claudopus TaxID=2862362 RepID=A0AAW0ACJ1_9AGAR